jgi:protein SCO1/2
MTVLLRSFAAFAAALALFALTSAPMRAGDDVPSLGSKVVIDLPDEQGKLIRTEDLSGKWLLVFFGYTSCPDICPTTLFEVAETLKQLGDLAKKIQPIFISIDPDRDQPRQLREYVNSFDSRILPLAGSPDRTARSAQSFGVSYFKVPGLRTGDYTIAHSTFMSVVGPEGGLVARFSTDRTSDQIASQLRKLMDAGRS